ncbi:hypothetical protein CR513_43859, partial [Mucuna pruriens]
MLGRYPSNRGIDHWKAAKKVLSYLQGTKYYMLTYRILDHLEVIRYSDSNYVGCVDSRKSTFGYIFLLVGGAKQRVSIKHIGTNLIIADLLTKALPPKTFIGHFKRMGIMDKSLLTM